MLQLARTYKFFILTLALTAVSGYGAVLTIPAVWRYGKALLFGTPLPKKTGPTVVTPRRSAVIASLPPSIIAPAEKLVTNFILPNARPSYALTKVVLTSSNLYPRARLASDCSQCIPLVGQTFCKATQGVKSVRPWEPALLAACGITERRAVVVFIPTPNGKVWAHIRGPESNPEKFRGQLALPGGKVEPGETDTQAIAREVREEMGAELTNAVPIFVGETEDGYTIVHFMGKLDNPPSVRPEEAGKIGEWLEVSLDDLKTSEMPLLDSAVDSFSMVQTQLPNGGTAWAQRAPFLPKGFAAVYINNKDNRCTQHAINVQLPPHLQVSDEEMGPIPPNGFRPSEFPAVARGEVTVGVFDCDNNKWLGRGGESADVHLLYHSRNGTGHYDALLAVGKIATVFPNGKGLDDMPVTDKTFVKLATRAILTREAWLKEPGIKIESRDQIFNEIEVQRALPASSPALDANQFIRFLLDPVGQDETTKHVVNALARTARLEFPVEQHKSPVPTVIKFDISNINNNNMFNLGNNTGQESNTEKFREVVGRMRAIMPTTRADANNFTRQDAEEYLAGIAQVYFDEAEAAWETVYEWLFRGLLTCIFGLWGNIQDADLLGNPVSGANGGVFVNTPGYYDTVPAGAYAAQPYLRVLADGGQQLWPGISYLAQLLSRWRDGVSTSSRYFLLAQRKAAPAREIPCLAGQVSFWTVLNNLHIPQLGAGNTATFSPNANDSISPFCANLPQMPKLLFIGQNVPPTANFVVPALPAPLGSAYNVAEFTNPQSWLDAISYLAGNYGYTKYLGSAFEKAIRSSIKFPATISHSLSLPLEQRLRVVGPEVMTVLRRRIFTMRMRRPTSTEYPAALAPGPPAPAPAVVLARNTFLHAMRAMGINTTGYDVLIGRAAVGDAYAMILCNAWMGVNGLWAGLFALGRIPYVQVNQGDVGFEYDSLYYQMFADIPLGSRSDQIAPAVAAPEGNLNADPFLSKVFSLPDDAINNLLTWLLDDQFVVRWGNNDMLGNLGLPAAPFNADSFHVQALIDGANPANNINVGDVTDMIAQGYWENRDFTLPAHGLVEERVVTFPNGLTLLSNMVLGLAVFSNDPDSERVHYSIRSLNAGTIVRKVLLLAAQIRAVADCVVTNLSISAVNVQSSLGQPVTGNAALDAIYYETEYSQAPVSNENELLEAFVTQLSSGLRGLAFPTSIGGDASTKYLRLSLADAPGFGSAGTQPYYANSEFLQTCLHPIQYKALVPVEFLSGGPISKKIEILSFNIPGYDNFLNALIVNESAVSVYELIGALRNIANAQGLSLIITRYSLVLTERQSGVPNVIIQNLDVFRYAQRVSESARFAPWFGIDPHYLIATPVKWAFQFGLGNDGLNRPYMGFTFSFFGNYMVLADSPLPPIATGLNTFYAANQLTAYPNAPQVVGGPLLNYRIVDNGPWFSTQLSVPLLVTGQYTRDGQRWSPLIRYTMGGNAAGLNFANLGNRPNRNTNPYTAQQLHLNPLVPPVGFPALAAGDAGFINYNATPTEAAPWPSQDNTAFINGPMIPNAQRVSPTNYWITRLPEMAVRLNRIAGTITIREPLVYLGAIVPPARNASTSNLGRSGAPGAQRSGLTKFTSLSANGQATQSREPEQKGTRPKEVKMHTPQNEGADVPGASSMDWQRAAHLSAAAIAQRDEEIAKLKAELAKNQQV